MTRIGQQHGTELWVLGDIDGLGMLISEKEQMNTWLEWSIMQGISQVLPLLLTTKMLGKIMGLLRHIMKHNFIPSILILASGVMALHYSTINQSSECPTTIANGASHTGKSTTMNVVLSITGMLLFSLLISALHHFLRSSKRSNNI